MPELFEQKKVFSVDKMTSQAGSDAQSVSDGVPDIIVTFIENARDPGLAYVKPMIAERGPFRCDDTPPWQTSQALRLLNSGYKKGRPFVSLHEPHVQRGKSCPRSTDLSGSGSSPLQLGPADDSEPRSCGHRMVSTDVIRICMREIHSGVDLDSGQLMGLWAAIGWSL